jgi:hypothetical protein
VASSRSVYQTGARNRFLKLGIETTERHGRASAFRQADSEQWEFIKVAWK